MECSDVRAALSARLDGEESAVPDELVDAHLASCAECQRWFTTVTSLGREMKIRALSGGLGPKSRASDGGAGISLSLAGTGASSPASSASSSRFSSSGLPSPDSLSSDDAPAASLHRVLQAAAASPGVTVGFRRRHMPLVVGRVALLLFAVCYVVWAGVLLFGNAGFTVGPFYQEDPDPAFARVVSDMAITRVALGVGLAWAAVRPRVASAVLPIYLALWAFGAGLATRDLVMGVVGPGSGLFSSHSPVWGLAFHLSAVVALLAVWLGRKNAVAPLRQSLRAAFAQPVSFSSDDLDRNSTYRPGDQR